MEFSISTDVECSAMIAKRSEAASVSGRLCDIAGMDAGTAVLAPGLRTEGAAMSNDDQKRMTEDQARDLKVTAKLKRRAMPCRARNGLSPLYLTGESPHA